MQGPKRAPTVAEPVLTSSTRIYHMEGDDLVTRAPLRSIDCRESLRLPWTAAWILEDTATRVIGNFAVATGGNAVRLRACQGNAEAGILSSKLRGERDRA